MVMNIPYNEYLPGHPRGRTYPNHNHNLLYNPQNNYNQEKPLKGRRIAKTQPTFKGFSFRQAKELLTHTEKMPVRKALEEIEGYIPKGINDGIDSVSDSLRKGGDSLEIKTVKSVKESFIDAVMALPNALKRGVDSLFGDKATKASIKAKGKEITLKNRLVGYVLELRQNAGRFDEAFKGDGLKKAIESGEKGLEAFLKEKNVDSKVLLKEAGGIDRLKQELAGSKPAKFIADLKQRYLGTVLNNKDMKKLGSFLPKYSGENAQLVNRIASGATTGAFVGNDFYNLAMTTSGDKKEAEEQRNKRYKQVAAFIGIYAYVGYILNSTFSRAINKSLPAAIAMGALIATSAEVISRVANKMPLLPQKPKGVDSNPYVIHAASIENKPYASSLTTYHAFKGNNKKEVSFSGNPASAAKTALKAADNWFTEMLPARIKFDDFKQSYNALQSLGSKQAKQNADEMLKIASTFTKGLDENAGIEQIGKAAAANDGYINVGRNGLYRAGKALVDTVVFPFKLIAGAGRMLVNGVRKLTGKEPLKAAKKNLFDHAKFVDNIVNATLHPEKHGTLGEQVSKTHSSKVLDYSADKLSTYMKLTGATAVPFLAVDAYNDTIKETKNTNISEEKAKQRVLQDSTRQAVSFWAVKSFNDLFKGLINHSLLGNATGVVLNCASYEAVTRLAVDQPLTPKTHEEMKEIEKRRLKNQSWFHKMLGGKIKTRDEKVIVGSTALSNNKISEKKQTGFEGFLNNKEFLSYNKKYGLASQ